ncbi:phosphotransferase family protein [Kribbella solani]|uniref:phosphotransferase family protein n=1 Tax=Kribbella solani TaxID=236067 RepID=UPI0029AE5352|nr:phosphotransferase [Kribbella solani]MDX2972181.1 phosphotransferase [Kribbella solani]
MAPVASQRHQHRVFRTSWDGCPAVCKAFVGPDRELGVHEGRMLDRLRNAHLPVPRLLWLGDGVCEACGSSVLVLITEQLPGEAADLVLERDRLGNRIWEQCSEILKRQFAIESSQATKGYLRERYTRFRAAHAPLLMNDRNVPRWAFEVMASAASQLPDPQYLALITFDWRLRHLFVQDGVITGMIDVEYAKLGDPLLEVANFIHDVRIHDLRSSADAADVLVQTIGSRGTDADGPSLLFYQARQAFAHAAIRQRANDLEADAIQAEIDLGMRYVSDLSEYVVRETGKSNRAVL